MTSTLPDLDSLALPAQVAQMITIRAAGYLFDHQIRYPAWEPPAKTLQHWLKLGVGGVILLGGSAAEVALRTQQLQEWANIPLLIAADVEEGVGQRFSGATWLPPPLALNVVANAKDFSLAAFYAEQMGAVTAQEARAIGLNWVLAPVVDVNNNPENPVINVRAFGETYQAVSHSAIAFIKGAQRYPVLTTAKHFPGHGDTAIDSHLELPVLDHSLERLQQIELPPFRAAISAGVDAVMSAHLQIPALDSIYPATLSDRILTRLLRQDMRFEGLIVTDALVMGAIANRYGANEAAVLAVAAGADILMMPADPEGAIHAVCAAVADGRIAADWIRASVERIWQAKAKVCSPNLAGGTSHTWESIAPLVQADDLTNQLSQPGSIALVGDILRDSLTVHRPSSLCQTDSEILRNLILVDDALNCKEVAAHSPAITIPSANGYKLQVVDRHTPACLPAIAETLQPTLLQLFIRGNPFRGSAGLTQTAQAWFNFLIQTKQLQALVIYGSPYVLDQFLPLLPTEVPYVFTYGQMDQAQAIALQTLFAD